MSEEINTTPAETPAAPVAEPDTIQNANATPAPSEPTPSETAKQVREQYTLKAEEKSEAPKGEGSEGEQPEQTETPFQLEFSEGTVLDEGLVGISTKHFKELGVDGKAAGACVERIVAEYQEQYYLQMAKNDADLKVEWGADYGARKTEVEQFLRSFCVKNNYPLDRVSPISSPDGYRLVYELMEKGGLVTSNAAGLRRSSVAEDMSWFKKAQTPGTPENAALNNTSDRSAWKEANSKYNRIAQEMSMRGL